MKKWTGLVLLMVLAFTLQAKVIWSERPEKVGGPESEKPAPYFFVKGDPAIDHFPLLKTAAEVNIAGVIAEVELTQIYKNNGKKTLEAVYIFPLGTKSAIHAMRMEIGKRIIEAEIEKKEEAQKIYQRAKEEGKVTSLLEQKRPNVFQMKVANIMPGDVVKVIVKYTELLVPEEGVYEFVFPTVVGPRYPGEQDKETLEGKDNWVETPYLREGKQSPYKFDIKVGLKTGLPLAKVWVTSHKVEIDKRALDEARVYLSAEEEKGGNRDFILRYTLRGKTIQTGLLLYPEEDEKFFLLMLEPPKRVNIKLVPPREYVFIVDVSGSMSGFPLEVSKVLIKKIISGLREQDYFNILFFSGGSKVLFQHASPATSRNKKAAVDMLTSMRGGGGTNMLSALKRALTLEKKEGLSRIIVIATDGYVAIEKEAFDLIREKLGQANFFAFGIGRGVNRFLIEGIARAGRGEPFVATDKEEAEKMAEKFLSYIKHPLLTDIKVNFSAFDAYEVEPLSLPDLFAQRPLILFGKYKKAVGKIEIKGNTPRGTYRQRLRVTSTGESKDNIALKYLWAREKIARLSDYGKVGVAVKEEVTKLGLKYHLMTEYTSFVAVDKLIRETGEVVTVKQPLPLPKGVSDYAIGGGARCLRYSISPRKMVLPKGKPAPMELREAKGVPSRLYLTRGVISAKITLNKVEEVIFSQVKKELENIFKKWRLKSLTLVLEIEKGKVRAIKIKKYKGEECNKKVLEKIFKKLCFPSSLKGVVEVSLEYI
jgi:Ca-activated chloride channel family protein